MKQSPSETLKKLKTYVEILYKWNSKLNLTSYTEQEFYDIGVFDCEVLLKLLEHQKIYDIADVGTGYGNPGVIIKIMNPSISVALIDVSEKKIAFLEYVSKILKLDFDIYHKRLPDKQWGKQFKAIVSKASMKEEMLLKVAETHLQTAGKLINFRGLTYPATSLSFKIIGNIFYRRKDDSCSNLMLREKTK